MVSSLNIISINGKDRLWENSWSYAPCCSIVLCESSKLRECIVARHAVLESMYAFRDRVFMQHLLRNQPSRILAWPWKEQRPHCISYTITNTKMMTRLRAFVEIRLGSRAMTQQNLKNCWTPFYTLPITTLLLCITRVASAFLQAQVLVFYEYSNDSNIVADLDAQSVSCAFSVRTTYHLNHKLIPVSAWKNVCLP